MLISPSDKMPSIFLMYLCPIQNGLKKRRCFITIAFQLCFRICHLGGPRKQRRTGIEWDMPSSGLCYDVNLLGET
jgi:hypothetical protein